MVGSRSDCELVIQAQSGNNKAFIDLVKRYQSLLSYKAGVYYISGADKDDVIQECLIGFYKAILNYQPGKNLSFKAFASICIDRQVFSALRIAIRCKHVPLNRYLPLRTGASYTGSCHDPFYSLVIKEQFNVILKKVDDFSFTERRVFRLYNQGYSYKQIALKMQLDEKSVDNAIHRARQKLKEVLKEFE